MFKMLWGNRKFTLKSSKFLKSSYQTQINLLPKSHVIIQNSVKAITHLKNEHHDRQSERKLEQKRNHVSVLSPICRSIKTMHESHHHISRMGDGNRIKETQLENTTRGLVHFHPQMRHK
jgi:transposase